MSSVTSSLSNAYMSECEYINRIPNFESDLAWSALVSGAMGLLIGKPETALIAMGLAATATLVYAFARPFFQDYFKVGDKFTSNQEFSQRIFAIGVSALIGRILHYPKVSDLDLLLKAFIHYVVSAGDSDGLKVEQSTFFYF